MSKEQVDIVWMKEKPLSISQIYSNGLEFSFVSPQLEQVHPSIFCKDFLQDVVWANIHRKVATIYGFTYDPSKHPNIDLNEVRLALSDDKGVDFHKKIENSLLFTNYFANLFEIPNATNLTIKNKPNSSMIIAPATWLSAPPLLSMFTLFLRAGMVHSPEENPKKTWDDLCDNRIKGYGKEDHKQMASSRKGIQNLLKVGRHQFFHPVWTDNYPASVGINTLHNHSGIVSFSEEVSVFDPYWHRPKVKELLKTA